MRRSTKKTLIAVVIIAAVAAAAGLFRPSGPKPPVPPPTAEPLPAPSTGPASEPSASLGLPVKPLTTSSAPATSAEDAQRAFKTGLELMDARKFVEARTELSKALFSEHLAQPQAEQARNMLTELFNLTIRSPVVYPGDPYTFHYEFKPGERLAGESGVVRREALRVPEAFMLEINNLASGSQIQAGKEYKLVRGPFHAVIYKSKLVMDLYLQPQGFPKVFVKRVPVGLGKNGATPTGAWRVQKGEKKTRPTWTPPSSSPLTGVIEYGQPGYGFGAKGLWIGLEGTDERTAAEHSYGIHSTNDPSSIGKQESLGCIRLRDEDIELAFNLLYEVWSTVQTMD